MTPDQSNEELSDEWLLLEQLKHGKPDARRRVQAARQGRHAGAGGVLGAGRPRARREAARGRLGACGARRGGGMKSRDNSVYILGSLWRDPKIEGLSNAALGFWLKALLTCAETKRPHITDRTMRGLLAGDKNGPRKVKSLLSAGLLVETGGGFVIETAGMAKLRRDRGRVDRKSLFERDGWKCVYCGDGVTMESGCADHVVPFVAGGSDELVNLATACAPCNRSKGAKTPEEWRR